MLSVRPGSPGRARRMRSPKSHLARNAFAVALVAGTVLGSGLIASPAEARTEREVTPWAPVQKCHTPKNFGLGRMEYNPTVYGFNWAVHSIPEQRGCITVMQRIVTRRIYRQGQLVKVKTKVQERAIASLMLPQVTTPFGNQPTCRGLTGGAFYAVPQGNPTWETTNPDPRHMMSETWCDLTVTITGIPTPIQTAYRIRRWFYTVGSKPVVYSLTTGSVCSIDRQACSDPAILNASNSG